MARSAASAVIVGILSIGTSAAAPQSKDNKPVIALETINRLKPVAEKDHDVYRFVWGPKAGEVTLLSWTQPVEVVDELTLKPTRKLGDGKMLIHMAVAPGREKLAWCENATQVEIHDLKTGKATTIETEMAQPDLAFSPDGKQLATGGSGRQAKVWEVATGKLIRTLDAGGEGGLTVVFSPDGKLLAVGNRNDTTRVYEVATGKLLHTLDRAMTQGLKFSPDNLLLAVGYVDGTIGLWDVKTGRLARSSPALVKEVYEVDWSPRGDLLVTAGREGKVVLWDPRELTVLKELDSPEWVIQARFSPDGSRLWTAGGRVDGGAERKVVVWGLPDR